jgi:hypothetical protein
MRREGIHPRSEERERARRSLVETLRRKLELVCTILDHGLGLAQASTPGKRSHRELETRELTTNRLTPTCVKGVEQLPMLGE